MSPLQRRSNLWVTLSKISIIIVALWSACAGTTLSSHQNDQLRVTRSGPFEAALLIASLAFDLSDIQNLKHSA